MSMKIKEKKKIGGKDDNKNGYKKKFFFFFQINNFHEYIYFFILNSFHIFLSTMAHGYIFLLSTSTIEFYHEKPTLSQHYIKEYLQNTCDRKKKKKEKEYMYNIKD